MVKYVCDFDSIFTAAKIYTSNFSDTPLRTDYCTSSKASLTAPSNQPYWCECSACARTVSMRGQTQCPLNLALFFFLFLFPSTYFSPRRGLPRKGDFLGGPLGRLGSNKVTPKIALPQAIWIRFGSTCKEKRRRRRKNDAKFSGHDLCPRTQIVRAHALRSHQHFLHSWTRQECWEISFGLDIHL